MEIVNEIEEKVTCAKKKKQVAADFALHTAEISNLLVVVGHGDFSDVPPFVIVDVAAFIYDTFFEEE